MGAGQDDAGAGGDGAVGQPPGVGMEHRHHRHDAVALAHAEGLGHAHRHGVQHHGAVRVDDALGPPGGARGVADAAGVALVQDGQVVVRVAARQQVLVALVARRHRRAGERHDEHPFRRDLGPDLLEQRQQDIVHQHEAVAGVVGDIGDIVGVQPEVEGVQHAAGAGDAEIGLLMRVVVPHHRGHRIAPPDPCACQRRGQPARAPVEVAEAVAVQRPVRQAGDDLAVAEQRAGPLQVMGEGERIVHHRRAHGSPLLTGHARMMPKARPRFNRPAGVGRLGRLHPSPAPCGDRPPPSTFCAKDARRWTGTLGGRQPALRRCGGGRRIRPRWRRSPPCRKGASGSSTPTRPGTIRGSCSTPDPAAAIPAGLRATIRP